MDPFVASTASEPVQHKKCTGVDGYNQGVYDPVLVDLLCISEGKVSVIRNMAGEQVTSSLRLYISGKINVTPKDIFIFDDHPYPLIARSFFKGNGIPGYAGTTVVYL